MELETFQVKIPVEQRLVQLFSNMFRVLIKAKQIKDFECVGCGKCCYIYDRIKITEDEANALGLATTTIEGDLCVHKVPMVVGKEQVHTCPLFDPESKGCTVYEQRPATCREYSCRGNYKKLKEYSIAQRRIKDWLNMPNYGKMSVILQFPDWMQKRLYSVNQATLDEYLMPPWALLICFPKVLWQMYTGHRYKVKVKMLPKYLELENDLVVLVQIAQKQPEAWNLVIQKTWELVALRTKQDLRYDFFPKFEGRDASLFESSEA